MLRVYGTTQPLYGRVVVEVRMSRLPKENVVDLFSKGFA